MWRCICGHAFYSALPPTCPSCDRAVDADVEETVTVDGRKLPFHVWEAEVLVRAAGWAVALRGIALTVMGAFFVLAVATADAPSCVTGVVLILFGPVLGATGLGAFRRARPSRWIMLTQSAVYVPSMLCMGLMVDKSKVSADWLIPFGAIAGQLATDALTLFAVLSRSGDWVWEWGGPREPIAPLSSAWNIGRSLRAWACVGAVGLAALAGLLLVWSVVPWAGLFP